MMLKISKEMLLELECGGMLVKGWESKLNGLKREIKMPWCGVIEEMLCKSIRKNGGLYTQCRERMCEGEYCVGCSVEISKNGELKWGSVYDRMKVGIEEYIDSKGNKPLKYSKIMKKEKISMEEVLAEGKRLGWEVPLCHFEENNGKRGRPKKEKSVVEIVEKKKRGRPKKEKEMVSQNVGEDLIASLLLGVGVGGAVGGSVGGSAPLRRFVCGGSVPLRRYWQARPRPREGAVGRQREGAVDSPRKAVGRPGSPRKAVGRPGRPRKAVGRPGRPGRPRGRRRNKCYKVYD